MRIMKTGKVSRFRDYMRTGQPRNRSFIGDRSKIILRNVIPVVRVELLYMLKVVNNKTR